MAKREKPAANRKPASRSMPVAPPPAVEEWDFSDLEDDMVVLRCPPIDRGEPDDDFDDFDGFYLTPSDDRGNIEYISLKFKNRTNWVKKFMELKWEICIM
jgi:hypothetical protein